MENNKEKNNGYVILCKACNKILGHSDTAIVGNLSPECPVCGQQRVSVEADMSSDATERVGMSFDIFVTNKNTGITRHFGTLMSKDDLTDVDRDGVFIRKMAKALAGLLTGQNINGLLNGRNE